MGVNSDATNDQINRTSREPCPFRIKKNCRISSLRKSFGSLFEPESEHLAHCCIQRYLPIGISLARTNDEDSLASRDAHVIQIERRTFSEADGGVEEHMSKCSISHGGCALDCAQKDFLFFWFESARSLRWQAFALDLWPVIADELMEVVNGCQCQINGGGFGLAFHL